MGLGVGQQTHRTLGRVLVLPTAPWDASGEEDWVFEERGLRRED